jgi:DNA ligase-4
MISDASAEGERHLMCVFFDVLQYNGKDLLDKSYCERRTLLERIISPTPGFAMVAERTCVKEPGTAFLDSVARLRNCFAKCVSVHEGESMA